jgi:hypothetical protein
MLNTNENKISGFIFVACFCSVMAYFAFLQFLTPTLYEYDPYYHVFATKLIKEHGLKYDFHWAQFSTYKDFYSDKELGLHLLTLPFMYLSDNIIQNGKFAIIFLNLLFFGAYAWVLRKYLPNYLAGLFLFLPVLSATFSVYFTYLRPATLANVILILYIYALMRKKWFYAGILTIIFVLSHVSFPIVVPIVIGCELLRYFRDRDFCPRNIYAVFISVFIGLLIHPNYPNNLLSTYINAILVPLYNVSGVPLDFGRELFAAPTNATFISSYAMFITVALVICLGLMGKMVKSSFDTMVWWMVFAMFFVMAMFGNRFWYQVNFFVFIFFASYVKDWKGERNWGEVVKPIRFFIIAFFLVTLAFANGNRKGLYQDLRAYINVSHHYEGMGRWMKYHVPAGERIYHAYWSDSPFFICVNPKNDYMMLLDPLFTFYKYPKEYAAYLKIKNGEILNPHRVLIDMFGARWGYAARPSWIAQVAISYPKFFEIKHQDDMGIIFKVLDKPGITKEEAEEAARKEKDAKAKPAKVEKKKDKKNDKNKEKKKGK